MLVMTACENSTFNWIFCVHTFSQLISLLLKPLIGNFAKTFHIVIWMDRKYTYVIYVFFCLLFITRGVTI